MFPYDQKLAGFLILFLLSVLVFVKRMATGSVLDKPIGSLFIQIVNAYNLLFLLVINPIIAMLLITNTPVIGIGQAVLNVPHLGTVSEVMGSVIYLSGYLLMAWALIRLGRSYQLGGSAPRLEDRMVVDGPYRFIRHPMYSAALAVSFGLACYTQSWVLFAAFIVYAGLIIAMIPVEENKLRQAYNKRYESYQQQANKLIPFIF
jgi:protein-S-isoprenylcysteine O-methyltransferase Ste14